MIKRVFLIVLDSLGIGKMQDSLKFGDINPNTLKSISVNRNFNIPNLERLGLGFIEGIDYIKRDKLNASVCRIAELSKGKDSTVGHWEIGGIVSKKPLPVYKNGFPKEIISQFEEKTGRKVLCNKPYSGTKVIEDFGEEHLKTGALIVYTSADSVFQIAASEDKVPLCDLYSYCEIAREILTGRHGVGRVIARPFVKTKEGFQRTANRKDFSLTPPCDTFLDSIKNQGLDVISVGKIYDLFAGKGITKAYKTHSNDEGMEITLDILKNSDFNGLLFLNLVDFDMKYGHRNDASGYAKALSDFDLRLGDFLGNMKKEDVLIITADHGCDPSDESTDHTREYIPCIMLGDSLTNVNLGTKKGFNNIGATVLDMLKAPKDKKLPKGFYKSVKKEKCCVYLLKCGDDTLYCGYTNDLKKRIKTHNSGKGAKYTRARLPVSLLYYEEFDNKSEALKRECEIKKMTKKEKMLLISKGEIVDKPNLI